MGKGLRDVLSILSRRRLIETLLILSGRKLSESIKNEVHLKGKSKGTFYFYELFGDRIARKSPLRELTGRGKFHLYTEGGTYVGVTE